MKKDFVSLAEARPDLAKEWNYEKNGDLKPEDVSCGSGKKVWWKLPYDVPDDYPVESLRGKHFEFEWEAAIYSRYNEKNGCPYLSGKAVWPGFNDLATINPELVAQWHPTKNGNLKPTQFAANAKKKVWWKLPYEVPADYPIVHLRGKHFDFEWEASIGNRIRGTNCPFLCQNPKVWKGFNDLATTNPSLAEEWDYKLNIGLTPSDITANSGKNVWWMLRYNVPNDYPVESLRGRFFKFEWITSVCNRSKGDDCPYLSGRAVWSGFNDLATINPELAAQWHPTKNGDLKSTQVTVNSNKKVWWLHPYDDPNTGKHFEFEWESLVNDRNNGNDCPFLSGKAVWPGFNDLATINPELAAQWHPIKNGDLKPTQVTVDSNKKVWWLHTYDDPNTGKHFEFEWESSIHNRNKGNGCPYLSGQAVWVGFNDLATVSPELAAQWHPTKNGNLKPTQVTANINKKVWWLYAYDDPNTGKHFEFEWESSIRNRNKSNGCPYLSGRAVWVGFNDLATVNPELTAQWHPTKNGNLKPTQVTVSSDKKIWWLLSCDDSKTGKHFDFEWKAAIKNRNEGNGCPYLSMQAVWIGFNDLATINPELAAQWHPTKNGNLRPTQVTANAEKKVWWFLSYDVPMNYPIKSIRGKHFNFEWQSTIVGRNKRGHGCPYLSGRAVWPGFNDLATVNPELTAQWHPTKNGDLKPTQVTANTSKKVWWLLPYDDPNTGKHFEFAWKSQIGSRNAGSGCPYLTTYKGEEYIKQYLQRNNISFNIQQKFSDLLGTGDGQLSYDFSIPDEKYGYILIEYNGIQHYEVVEYFGGEEKFKIQKEHDKRKRDYAKKHGYKLITIKYTYDTYESVEEYLDNELKKLGVINSTKKEESVNDAA